MKQLELDQAIDLVQDGTFLGVGGVLLKRKPMRFLADLVRAGRSRLRVATFLGSVDVELLAAAGALDSFSGGYVGFEYLGFAPAFQRAVERSEINYREYSEFLFMAGLRAAAGGLPFYPARAALGSDLVAELGLSVIADPYGGCPVVAVPPLTPEVAVIHAEVADTFGNVAAPSFPDFLVDFDVALARAAGAVIVTAERVVERLDVPAQIFGFQVTAVVETRGGARPSGVPGRYPPDVVAIRRYLTQPNLDSLLEAVG
ncbi:MAG: hypothetical protein KatS3mg011_2370 [Acidimicrobiia bacterium]|nr:MAG: hypothetical protein KatS3mg011_2370 [Acidimicrobiia bacterium]